MLITPNGTVQLYKNVSLDPDYNKTFYFENETEQNNFFSGSGSVPNSITPVLTVNNVTYQREKRNTIRLEATTRPVFNCNYMRFRNTDNVGNTYPNKWYYAFILNLEYVNNTTVEITYQIDVMQTWLPKTDSYNNDYELGNCLVVRNHTITDEIGDNLEPEDFGDDESTFANNDSYTIDIYDRTEVDGVTIYNNDWYIVMLIENDIFLTLADDISSVLTGYGKRLIQGHTFYSGVYNGLGIICIEVNHDMIESMDTQTIFTQLFTNNGIKAMYMCPAFFAPSEGKPVRAAGETDEHFEERQKEYFNKWKKNQIADKILKNMDVEVSEETGIPIPETFGAYIPINNKLKTYPYNYLYVSDNRGGYHFYRYEFFENNKAYFYGEGCFTSQPEMIIYPRNYKNRLNNYEEKMVIDSFPMCSWQSPDLVDWLAKGAMLAINAGNVPALVSNSTTTTNKTDVFDNTITNTNKDNAQLKSNTGRQYNYTDNDFNVKNIKGTINRTEETTVSTDRREIGRRVTLPHPHICHSVVGNGDILLGTTYNQTFTIYQMQILSNFAYKIDDYFSRYGYAINDVTTPNINARPKFTYIKTSGCCMTNNNIPASVEAEICAIFDKGITFWKDKGSVDRYDYTLYVANKPIGGE